MFALFFFCLARLVPDPDGLSSAASRRGRSSGPGDEDMAAGVQHREGRREPVDVAAELPGERAVSVIMPLE